MVHPGAGDTTATVVQAVIMIVLMSATQFYIQKQLSVKNMSEAALNSPMFRQQQMIMRIFPIIFAVSGINFPLGVMYYWTVSNLWSLGQQWWVIRNNPTPGSQAERELNARRAAKACLRLVRPVSSTRRICRRLVGVPQLVSVSSRSVRSARNSNAISRTERSSFLP